VDSANFKNSDQVSDEQVVNLDDQRRRLLTDARLEDANQA
jgi:hypothetical protein